MAEQTYLKDSYIFREGETARYAYVLQTGTVEIVKLGVDGEDIMLDDFGG